jgi:hypothetical protein
MIYFSIVSAEAYDDLMSIAAVSVHHPAIEATFILPTWAFDEAGVTGRVSYVKGSLGRVLLVLPPGVAKCLISRSGRAGMARLGSMANQGRSV